MNDAINEVLRKFPDEIIELYGQLRTMLLDSTAHTPEEKLWAKLPSFYVGERFVRLIPFKDHINIEAAAILSHREELTGYKITPKGMLQLYTNQSLPVEVLKQIFAETLG